MTASEPPSMRRVGIRCDAGAAIGVGHLVRCVALAEELTARGVEVVFLGAVSGSPWAAEQLRARGLPLVPAPREPALLASLVDELCLDAVVLDSYTLAPGTGAALRAGRDSWAGLSGRGPVVLAIIDGDPLGQEADLYLDQNLGAEHRPFPALPGSRASRPGGARRLAGASYVLLRDSVRRCRRSAWARSVPRVLCFFGGTDSAGVAPAWAAALRRTGLPYEAAVVSPVPFGAEGRVRVIPPTDRLPELMAEADLVLTAAGSASWELLHLGVPTALTWVADNQSAGYEALVRGGLAAGLGPEPGPEAVATLARLLATPALREEYGRRGRSLIDGRGRERVADALLDPSVRGGPR
ncbi:PseG/SpsG family protein [Nonomuraea sp. NPDC049714]|uniref:PseG/SpsG family protein n=1 Tax=Nonomuraea sp. NPDC049714 TaxID=3364357 RepID=UPI0037BBBECC